MANKKNITLQWHDEGELHLEERDDEIRCLVRAGARGEKALVETYAHNLLFALMTCAPVGWATDVQQPKGDAGYPHRLGGPGEHPQYFRPTPLGVGQMHGPLMPLPDIGNPAYYAWLEKKQNA